MSIPQILQVILVVFLAFISLWLVLAISIAIHEGSHATAAKLLGVPIKKVAIGWPKIFSVKIGVPVEIGLWPIFGYVIHNSAETPWYKRFLITIAGPLATFALAVGLTYAIGGSVLLASLKEQGFMVIPILKGIVGGNLEQVINFFPQPTAPDITSLIISIMIPFAFLNLTLAVLNAIPIPPLDGGQALFALLEGLLGKKVRYVQVSITLIAIVAFLVINIRPLILILIKH